MDIVQTTLRSLRKKAKFEKFQHPITNPSLTDKRILEGLHGLCPYRVWKCVCLLWRKSLLRRNVTTVIVAGSIPWRSCATQATMSISDYHSLVTIAINFDILISFTLASYLTLIQGCLTAPTANLFFKGVLQLQINWRGMPDPTV